MLAGGVNVQRLVKIKTFQKRDGLPSKQTNYDEMLLVY